MEKLQLGQLHQLLDFGTKIFRNKAPNYELLDVDNNFCKMLGFTKQELFINCRNKSMELIVQSDLEETEEYVKSQIEKRGTYTCHYRMRRRDGSLIFVWETGTLEKDEDGNEIVHCMIANINELQNIKRENEIICNTMPGGKVTLFISENNFYITKANSSYFNMIGAKQDEYFGTSGMYIFSEDLEKVRKYLVRCSGQKEEIDCEFRIRRADTKEKRWFHIYGTYCDTIEDGNEYLCLLFDVTYSKRQSFLLEQEKEKYKIAMGTTATLLFDYDMNTQKIKIYNNAKAGDVVPDFQDGAKGTLEEIFLRDNLIYKEDIGKLKLFMDAPVSYSDKMRLLASNEKIGITQYHWFAVEITKLITENKVSHLLGCVKNLKKEKNNEDANIELRNIFLLQSSKIYEMIIRVNINSGNMKGFFLDKSILQDLYAGDSFNEYIDIMAENDVYPEECERFLQAFDLHNMVEVLEFGKSEEVLFFRIKDHEGQYRHKCMRYSFMGEDRHTIIISIQDVHEMREEQLREEEANRKILASALDEAKNTMDARRNFFSMLTKEFKSPLHVIRTGLRNIDRKGEEYEEMLSAVNYIMGIMKNISNYQQIESGQIELKNGPVNVENLLENCFQTWQERAERNHVHVYYKMDFQWKGYCGDEMRLNQVMTNILGNCVKFAPEDSVVRVWCGDEDQGCGIGKLTLLFNDSGCSLDEQFLERLSLDNADEDGAFRKKQEAGTDFSLVFARKLVELMGGSFQLLKETDRTNSIRIEIPLQCLQENWEHEEKVYVREEGLEEVDLNGYSILLVQREESENVLLGPLLKLKGAQVDVARSGKEGITLWKRYPQGAFHAILMEGNLGDMDYLDFTEIIRGLEQKKGSSTLLLALLDSVEQNRNSDSIELGVNAILSIPLDLRRFIQLLDITYKMPEKA